MEKLFEFAAIHHPKAKSDEDKKAGRHPKSVLLLEPKRVLARDEKEVAIKAARELPDNVLDDLENVEIVIRPF